MKTNIFLFFLSALLAPAAVIVNFAVIFFLPFPFSEFNVLASIVAIALLISQNSATVWWSIPFFTVFDWYTVGPFGLVLAAGICASLCVLILYRKVVTNRGVWSAALLTASFIIAYRLLYYMGISAVNGSAPSFWSPILIKGFSELIITTAGSAFFYFILARFFPALRGTHAMKIKDYAGN